MDIHDIARSVCTYGIKGYYIVTPIEDQHELVERILAHWRSERARIYHPDRHEAISLVRLARSFEEVKTVIQMEHQEDVEVVLTDAQVLPNSVSYQAYRQELENPNRGDKPVILVFGTGWGVAQTFYSQVDRILEPVYGLKMSEGKTRYNHLSVRAAVAIILDRLFG